MKTFHVKCLLLGVLVFFFCCGTWRDINISLLIHRRVIWNRIMNLLFCVHNTLIVGLYMWMCVGCYQLGLWDWCVYMSGHGCSFSRRYFRCLNDSNSFNWKYDVYWLLDVYFWKENLEPHKDNLIWTHDEKRTKNRHEICRISLLCLTEYHVVLISVGITSAGERSWAVVWILEDQVTSPEVSLM